MREVAVNKSKTVVGFKGFQTDTDESLMDMAYTKKAYNFAFEDGVLTGGIGIDIAKGLNPDPHLLRREYPALPDGRGFKNIFLYKRKNDKGENDDRIVVHLDNNRFAYTSVLGADEWHYITEALGFNTEVTAVNYNYNGEDVLLLSANNAPLIMLKDNVPYMCGNAPEFSSIAVHNERVFGSINGAQNQVWFSDDFDPKNWSVSADEAGFINFADECGEVIKLVSFLNYLYIFREYGIFRLTAYGEQSEFMLKKVFTDTGRIYKSSIEVCGDKIIFYASDGLYAFDGYEVTRIAKQLPPIYQPRLMSCAYLDDYYYMACRLWEEGWKNNAVIRYSLREKSLSVLYGYCVKVMRTVKVSGGVQVLCAFDLEHTNRLGEMSKSGCVMGGVTIKKYESPTSAFSSSSLKVIRHVTLQTDNDLTLTVTLDEKPFKYRIKGSELLKTLPIERSGRKIKFEIECESAEAYVTPITVTLDTLRI